ncbi:MAG: phosphate permease [Candidatus Bathyarchaeota archaeon B23]|nr:MAG: phosphate permease [Candidatus Bathyarchaeota archaeon B23]
MEAITLMVVLLALYVAWAIGSNNESVAPLAGCRFLSVRWSLLLGASTSLIGALLLGGRVEETMGSLLLKGGVSLMDAVIVMGVVATSMAVASISKKPISSTHSAVGAIVGLGLLRGGLNGVDWKTLILVATSWAVFPLLSLLLATALTLLFRGILQRRVRGLRDRIRVAHASSIALLPLVTIISLSRGGNDVANATSLLSVLHGLDALVFRLLGGAGMALGLALLGGRVVRAIGLDLIQLRPETALASQISVALILLSGTLLGLPLSGTHILIAALIGLGLAERKWINVKALMEIFYAWILVFAAAAGAATFLAAFIY